MRRLLLICFMLLTAVLAHASDTLTVRDNQAIFITKQYFTELEDKSGQLQFADVLGNGAFHESDQSLPFLKYTDSVIWVKLVLQNKTSQTFLPISISSGIIDEFDLYYVTNSHRPVHLGTRLGSLTDRQVDKNRKVINFIILPDSARTVYLRISSSDSMAIPINVQSADISQNKAITENLTLGFFMGIIIVMALYNLLLYILVKDINYFYYVLYIIFLGLTQWQVRGFDVVFNFMSKSLVNNYLIPVTRICLWYSILLFVYEFLEIRKNIPKKYRKHYRLLYAIVTMPLVCVFLKLTTAAYSLITIAAFINSVVLLVIGITLYIKGFKPAKFFMLGWGLFLITILATIARNKGLIEFNSFTANVILYSSAFELVMFSVALADRINFYRKQHNESQALSLAIARENERLITGQNIALENRVKERTEELIASNKSLSVSIENLKSAQIQLIETEKMASLGQLTAGIAHEINNPINFVGANIKPLKMDLEELFTLIDLYEAFEKKPFDETLKEGVEAYRKKIDIDFIKNEIQTLLDGIEEGAGRTVEIVQSLRAFSRTDEPVLKPADVNRSILTTLVILRSTIPYYIEIKPVLDKLPMFNCYAGKLNQVFVNLINNSIQAIKAKPEHHNEFVMITTADHPEHIIIEISDTGIGMTDEVRQHIFDPFYTTKDIGEGTGLGLSIVFGIIEKHHGTIEVFSQPGQGTTFRITLPKTLEA